MRLGEHARSCKVRERRRRRRRHARGALPRSRATPSTRLQLLELLLRVLQLGQHVLVLLRASERRAERGRAGSRRRRSAGGGRRRRRRQAPPVPSTMRHSSEPWGGCGVPASALHMRICRHRLAQRRASLTAAARTLSPGRRAALPPLLAALRVVVKGAKQGAAARRPQAACIVSAAGSPSLLAVCLRARQLVQCVSSNAARTRGRLARFW